MWVFPDYFWAASNKCQIFMSPNMWLSHQKMLVLMNAVLECLWTMFSCPRWQLCCNLFLTAISLPSPFPFCRHAWSWSDTFRLNHARSLRPSVRIWTASFMPPQPQMQRTIYDGWTPSFYQWRRVHVTKAPTWTLSSPVTSCCLRHASARSPPALPQKATQLSTRPSSMQ